MYNYYASQIRELEQMLNLTSSQAANALHISIAKMHAMENSSLIIHTLDYQRTIEHLEMMQKV